jgi:uncharacterized protein with von Willebrand factor type A (vWA) domain
MPDGHLLDNLMHFGRVLRTAGLPVGTGRLLEAVRAVEAVGITDRDAFYHALVATLTTRREQRDVFDQAFHLFWRNPKLREKMMQLMLPNLSSDIDAPGETAPMTRAQEAFAAGQQPPSETEAREDIELDASLTWSDRELLQAKDFEAMSIAELAAAKAAIKRMRLVFPDIRTRRMVPDKRGSRPDGRMTLRLAARRGGDSIDLRFRSPGHRAPPIVILCDISGSMERYARVLLHFVHGLTSDRDRVHSFLFGTRLTNITRSLRHRDVDVAVAAAAASVQDWSGGTRIGRCLHDFNRLWARRVLGVGATVLFISDGLDRDAGADLGPEVERIAKSARRLIWLNPLLRFEGFEPKSLGIRAILPHVDEFRPVHNLNSLTDLARALASPYDRASMGKAA